MERGWGVNEKEGGGDVDCGGWRQEEGVGRVGGGSPDVMCAQQESNR